MFPIRSAILPLLASLAVGSAAPETTLWYGQPATDDWMTALPLGNGRLGAMVFGTLPKEHLMLNESSLWSGWADPNNDRPGAAAALVEIRRLLNEGNCEGAKQLTNQKFLSPNGYGKPDFGAYQSFCDAWFEFAGPAGDPKSTSAYRRDLDLSTALSTVTYQSDGVDYRREYFASHPGQAIVARFTASAPGKISFQASFTTLHRNHQTQAGNGTLRLSGQVDNGPGNPQGMEFAANMLIEADGGTVTADPATGTLKVSGANSATVKITGATNYRQAYPTYRGDPPATTLDRQDKALRGKSYDALKKAHLADYQQLFSRVALDLDDPNAAANQALPTGERLKRYAKSRNDRGLESLVFQYGRYLLIASSRPGGLPANLQGIWNNSNTPAWSCDYHLNINLEMNYWPAGPCNLAECLLPLSSWLADLRPAGEKTARIHYGTAGWVVHHTANVWGFTAPGADRGVHMLEAESAAFICNNLWDYYLFTGDKAWLRKTGWPLLKGAATFWLENLQPGPNGTLVVSPAFSPEHGPLTNGAHYQIMIVRDLFSNCIQAARAIGGEDAFAARLKSSLGRLAPPQIGAFGQLCEWLDPDLEKNVRTDRHRHVSHLFAVYPGHSISPAATPELARAAIQSLNYRGDLATGWSAGWKINLWARLHDGDRAWKLASTLVAKYLAPNLFDLHPPFQIDGNFGYTAGTAEMLLQFQDDTIQLLPALPSKWPAGKVTGLRASGGYTVDITWAGGKVTASRITSATPRQVKVSINGETKTITTERAPQP